MKLSSLVAAPLLLATLASPALAETSTTAPVPPPSVYQQPPPAEAKDSINLSPLGLLFGDLSVTYEHLFAGGQGVIVDAGFGQQSGNGGSEAHGSFGVGYGLYNMAWGAGLLGGPAIAGFVFERAGFPRLTLFWAPLLLVVAVLLGRVQSEVRLKPDTTGTLRSG